MTLGRTSLRRHVCGVWEGWEGWRGDVCRCTAAFPFWPSGRLHRFLLAYCQLTLSTTVAPSNLLYSYFTNYCSRLNSQVLFVGLFVFDLWCLPNRHDRTTLLVFIFVYNFSIVIFGVFRWSGFLFYSVPFVFLDPAVITCSGVSVVTIPFFRLTFYSRFE